MLKFEAVHDFDPVTTGEIELRRGDIVLMHQTPPDRNQWWNGQNTRSRQVGYFPGNFVKEVQAGPPNVPPRPPRDRPENTNIPGPTQSPAPVQQNITTPSTLENSSSMRLEDQIWYWGQCSRQEVNDIMADKEDGNFLVRDALNVVGQYTLTLRKAGANKLIRVVHKDGKYGFSHPLEYDSVIELIQHFQANSLSHYNSGLDICLTNPLPRPLASRQDGGGDLIEQYNRVSDTLEELTQNFEKEVNKKNECGHEIETIKRIELAQKDILLWLKNQSVLFDERYKISSPNSLDLMNEQQQILKDQLRVEQRVLDDLELKHSMRQSMLRKLESSLRSIKLEIKDKSRILHELDRQLRNREMNPAEIREQYLNRLDYADIEENAGYEEPGNLQQPPPPVMVDTAFPMETYLRQGLTRDEYRQVLLNKPSGTFLIRPSIHNPGQFTLDIVVHEEIKKVSIIHENGMYGVVSPTTFLTITQLVEHYRRRSLREHNRQLDTPLLYPAFHPQFRQR